MSEDSIGDQTEEWTPHEQRWRACVGHMRIALRPKEGVCNVLFEEDEESVAVLVLVCGEADRRGDPVNCPVHIYLEQPLGERAVLDVVNNRRPVPYRNVYQELQREFDLPRS